MAATVQILEVNANTAYVAGSTAGDNIASGTGTGSLNFGSTASTNPSPVVKLASGTAYSIKKWIKLRASVAPTGQINNMLFYTAGDPTGNTGIAFRIMSATSLSYPNATPTAAAAADDSASVVFSTYTSGGTKRTINATNAGPFTTTGDLGDWLVCYATVADTATPGSMGTSTMTWTWDET